MLEKEDRLDAHAAAAETYVEAAFGLSMGLEPIAPASLPHFILDRYRLWKGALLGQPMLLVAGQGWASGAGFTTDFLKQRELLRRELQTPLVVLLLDHAPAAIRRQFVSRQIAFLAPGSQLYIPEALLDLRERGKRAPSETGGQISPTAQLLLLAALQGEPVDAANLTTLGHRFSVATMSMSRALDELEAMEIARPRHVGRQRRLDLVVGGGELWNAIKDRLQSPVRKVRLVAGTLEPKPAPRAGESALAFYTMLGEPRIQRRAIAAARWRQVAPVLDTSEAAAFAMDRMELETWIYEPAVLARDGVVDRLSLYLSVRHSLNERVAQAADQLLEPFGW